MQMISIHIGAIHIEAPARSQQRARPPILIRSAEFQRGYDRGLYEGAHGPDAAVAMTNDDLIEDLKIMIADGAFQDEDDATLQYALGSLLGRLIANT